MRKLELKDIIGYLPYDLKCLNAKSGHEISVLAMY